MTRVAIIGGGIGGLTAAIALSRAGVEVRVYEAAAELREIGAGVALHPNAMRVLRAIGVEDAVRKVAGRSEWAVTRNGMTGRLISKTSRSSRGRCRDRGGDRASGGPARRARRRGAAGRGVARRALRVGRDRGDRRRSRSSPTAPRPRPT